MNIPVHSTCFPHKPLQSCIYCGIMHYNGAHAGLDLVDCGGGCSCLLLLQIALMLVQMFAPCACDVPFYQLV